MHGLGLKVIIMLAGETEEGKPYLILMLMFLDKLIQMMVRLDIASLLEHNFVKVLYDVDEGRHSVFPTGSTDTTNTF